MGLGGNDNNDNSSGQQSVTGFPTGDDTNSYFIVMGSMEKPCTRGEPITCGSVIRLKHQRTNKMLHSHLIRSPLSQQQEVSAGDLFDTGDHWQVECTKKTWKREQGVKLKHVDTYRYLTANARYAYGTPINGQLEIAAKDTAGDGELWIAQEGIYISNQ